MKIIVDAMGGDNAPMEIVKGAIQAVEELKTDVMLVGNTEAILRCVQELGHQNLPKGLEIANAADVVTMEDDPARAVRDKKDSSMSVMLYKLRDGEGDAAVSAGSTGALLSGATLVVKRVRGVRRAALAPILPSKSGGCVLIDCGANVECSAEYLQQFHSPGIRTGILSRPAQGLPFREKCAGCPRGDPPLQRGADAGAHPQGSHGGTVPAVPADLAALHGVPDGQCDL